MDYFSINEQKHVWLMIPVAFNPHHDISHAGDATRALSVCTIAVRRSRIQNVPDYTARKDEIVLYGTLQEQVERIEEKRWLSWGAVRVCKTDMLSD